MLFHFVIIIAITLTFLLSPAFASLTELKTVQRYQGDLQASSYVVKLKDSASKASHLGWLEPQLANDDSITHRNWSTQFFNGYAGKYPMVTSVNARRLRFIRLGKFNESALNLLRSSSDVDYIQEDGIVSIKSIVNQYALLVGRWFITEYFLRTDAPWGIASLSWHTKLSTQNPAYLNFTYTYNAAAGDGVDVYVIGKSSETCDYLSC